ncbi:unnamed protein product, partial [Polarella glacialis]
VFKQRGAGPLAPGATVTVETPMDQAAAKAIIGTRVTQALVEFSACLTESMQVPPGWSAEARRPTGSGSAELRR